MKRSLEPSSSKKNETKKERTESLKVLQPAALEQAKLYFTPIGGITSPLVATENSIGFSDLIEIIRPKNSIHFNFMVDLEWVMSCYPPSIRDCKPITIIVGADDSEVLKRKSANRYPNVKIHGASLPIPYGTHHSKLSILANDYHVHIIISTANLITSDWEFKTQQFWHGCGRRIKENEEIKPNPFQNDLLEYFSYYESFVNEWIEILKKTDFGQIEDRLVFSVPGYHKGENMKKLGHLKLRHLLDEIEPKTEIQNDKSASSQPPQRPLFIAQCSSIGSLGKMPTTWFRGEFLKSLEANRPMVSSAPSRFFVIYPNVENVRESCEGYEGGCSLPYRNEVHDKQIWLGQWLCQWRSEKALRSKLMPHCKSYVKIVDQKIEWMLMTSANLSKAAWGEIQKNGEQICIRSWEIGVLIKDPNRCQLPYDYPIVRYQLTDKPWTTDKNHEKPDIFDE